MHVIDELFDRHFKYNYRHTRHMFYSTFHSHQGIEFLYMFEGNVKVIQDDRLHILEPGSLVMFQPFQLHRVEPDPKADYRRIVFIIAPQHMDQQLISYPKMRSFFQLIWKEKIKMPAIKHPLISDLFEKALLHLPQNNNENEERELYNLFTYSLLQTLQWAWKDLSASGQQGQPGVRSNPHAEEIMQFIDKHYKEDLDLQLIADRMHLSTHYISHLFHEAAGCTITDYILARKMKEACYLLKTSSKSIQEIGETVGFPNTSYFIQVFKKRIGATPRKYRFE